MSDDYNFSTGGDEMAMAESELEVLRACLRALCEDEAIRQRVRLLFKQARAAVPHYSLSNDYGPLYAELRRIEASLSPHGEEVA